MAYMLGRKVKTAALVIAAIAFMSGVVVSLWYFPIDVTRLNPVYLGLLLLTVPLTWLVVTWNFMLLGAVFDKQFGFRKSFKITLMGIAANMLPIPGATLVKAAALKSEGVQVVSGTFGTVVYSFIWLGIAVTCSAVALFLRDYDSIGISLFIVGVVISFVCTAILKTRYSMSFGITVKTILNNSALVLIDVVRLYLCFHAISINIDPIQVAALAMAGALGSAVSIVPAGLGVREYATTALGLMVGIFAASAYLAASLNRLAGMLVSVPAALWITKTTISESTDNPTP